MEQLLFNFEGNKVEVINYNGQALFNPRDVGECLEISDVKSTIRNFDNNQKIIITNQDLEVHSMHFRKLNNRGEAFLTTSGVYRLVFQSRKPSAEKFKDWIANEVLPQIGTHGVYIPGNTPEQIVNNGMTGMDSMISFDINKELVKDYLNTYDTMKRMESQMYLDRFKYYRTDKIYEGRDVYYEIREGKFNLSKEELYKILMSLQFIVPIKYSSDSEYAFDTTKLLSLDPLQLTYKGFVELCYNIEMGGKLIYHLK